MELRIDPELCVVGRRVNWGDQVDLELLRRVECMRGQHMQGEQQRQRVGVESAEEREEFGAAGDTHRPAKEGLVYVIAVVSGGAANKLTPLILRRSLSLQNGRRGVRTLPSAVEALSHKQRCHRNSGRCHCHTCGGRFQGCNEKPNRLRMAGMT